MEQLRSDRGWTWSESVRVMTQGGSPSFGIPKVHSCPLGSPEAPRSRSRTERAPAGWRRSALHVSGLAQCAELCWQLRGLAGRRQVPGAKVALQHNLGLGGAVVVTLYRMGFPRESRWAGAGARRGLALHGGRPGCSGRAFRSAPLGLAQRGDRALLAQPACPASRALSADLFLSYCRCSRRRLPCKLKHPLPVTAALQVCAEVKPHTLSCHIVY